MQTAISHLNTCNKRKKGKFKDCLMTGLLIDVAVHFWSSLWRASPLKLPNCNDLKKRTDITQSPNIVLNPTKTRVCPAPISVCLKSRHLNKSDEGMISKQACFDTWASTDTYENTSWSCEPCGNSNDARLES